MTKKIIAYNSIGDKLDDEFGWEVFGFCAEHGLRALMWFLIVSSPVFVTGAVIAPQGINRLDHGAKLVGQQHEFLWKYGISGIESTFNAIGSVVGPILDNGASEAE